ncbi:hypothetical protein Tco_0828679 [Tanacetum coccineum]
MNKKSYSFDLDTFTNILQICPKLPGQHFVDTLFEEDILAFMRELGYSGTIKLLSDVKVDFLPQPWRTFSTIINKCLSGKVTGIDTFRLFRAKILWGLYHQENVDFVYLLWEDLVYQIENKESRKNKNTVDWHMVNDDPILTTMMFIPQHEVVQKYGAILPIYLTTQAMKESEAYKTYHALTTGKVVKATAKVAKSGKKKQPAIGLDTLSDITLTEAEQLKLATKRILNQTHISQPSGSGTHEGTGVKPGVPDVPTYHSDDEEEIPWKSSDEDDNDDNKDDDDDQGVPYDDQGDDNDSERTISDTKGDDFVHPKFTSYDTEEKHNEEDKDEESFDPRVQTPSHYEPLDDEANDDLPQSRYAEEEEVNVEQTFEANINLEGRDAKMTDAPKTTQVIEDTHMTLTPVNLEGQQQSSSVSSGFISNMLNPNLDTGIDYVLNVETTSLVDVPVTSQATTTLPQPSNPLIPPVQQTPTPILATTLSSKLKESVDVAVQLKSDRLREEAQTQNESILLRIKKLVNEQLESEVLIRSSHKAKSTHAIAANLFELELKKILIDKMESNKSIDRSNEQKNLYKALVDAYAADKDLLDAYGDTVTIKRRRDEVDDDQEPSARIDWGSKRRRTGKEPESSSAPKETTFKSTGKSTKGSKSRHQSAGQSTPAKELIHTEDDFEEPTHQEIPSLDRDWNKTLPADHGPVQPWLSNLAREEDPQESFYELMDTPLDFSAFVMNRLKVDTLTPELLAGPTFELMKALEKIIEWHGYKHLDWITVRRDDDKLYSFKEGDLKRLRLQDIEDMLILLVQEKLSNLKIEEPYFSPRGFIYQNKDKKNRLMYLDELHKFSDGTLDDVQTALDDRLKGIRMEYLPKTIWRQSDRERAIAMIQAIDKRLKSRRIMRSLEKFVGERPYEGDFQLMQRTI